MVPNIPFQRPSRYRKGIMTTFGVIVAPFYKCDEVAREGAPVVIDTAKSETVKVAVPGSSSAGCLGFLAQQTYDPSVLGELAGYEFFNNTKARIGDAVGVITGAGWVETLNYAGEINEHDELYPGPSGYLVAFQTGSDKSVGVAETSGTDGDSYIRVRVDFSLV